MFADPLKGKLRSSTDTSKSGGQQKHSVITSNPNKRRFDDKVEENPVLNTGGAFDVNNAVYIELHERRKAKRAQTELQVAEIEEQEFRKAAESLQHLSESVTKDLQSLIRIPDLPTLKEPKQAQNGLFAAYSDTEGSSDDDSEQRKTNPAQSLRAPRSGATSQGAINGKLPLPKFKKIDKKLFS